MQPSLFVLDSTHLLTTCLGTIAGFAAVGIAMAVGIDTLHGSLY